MDEPHVEFNFYHRHEGNGYWVSVCKRCFGKAAKAKDQAGLFIGEEKHFCTEGVIVEISSKSHVATRRAEQNFCTPCETYDTLLREIVACRETLSLAQTGQLTGPYVRTSEAIEFAAICLRKSEIVLLNHVTVCEQCKRSVLIPSEER